MMVSGCDEPMARFWILTMEFGTRALGRCGWIFSQFYRCAAAAASGVNGDWRLEGKVGGSLPFVDQTSANSKRKSISAF